MILYAVCGIPGSGKTTYSRQLAKELGAKLYCYDERPDGNHLGKIESSHIEMWRDIFTDLNNGEDVICDDLHTTKRERVSILHAVNDSNCKKVLIVMETPLEVCLERNANRINRLPDNVVKAIHRSYEPPTFGEGWDEIIRYQTT
jgi:tRNA uridine 5-carbamoylmethylation protein Kti12